MLQDLEDVPVPTVAAVNGGALGGGLELALTCDMIIAADTAFFGQVEVAVGLSAACSAARNGSRSARASRAPRRLRCSAAATRREAFERWGIINLVVPESELASASMTWARQLAAGPTQVIKGIKMQANLAARGGIAAADARQVEINDMIWKAKTGNAALMPSLRPGPQPPYSREIDHVSAPLQGLRVIDFTRVLAGPHCTKTLRDLGADVTKIEPPSGDLGRVGLPHVNGIGLYYVQQNAGKRNLSLDLNFAEAREIVGRLCRDADVIVENFRPGTLARFGFGYEDVKAFNPRIIYVSLERIRAERRRGGTVRPSRRPCRPRPD